MVREELLAGLCERKILFQLKIYDRLQQATAKRIGCRVLRSSFSIWSRFITVQLELRQHSSLRVTMSGSGTHRTAARLASIGERADVRFTSLTFLAHATMDLHSQHTIVQDFVPNTFSSVSLLISDHHRIVSGHRSIDLGCTNLFPCRQPRRSEF